MLIINAQQALNNKHQFLPDWQNFTAISLISWQDESGQALDVKIKSFRVYVSGNCGQERTFSTRHRAMVYSV